MADKKDIVIDLSKVTKRQVNQWRLGRRIIAEDEDSGADDLDEFDFNNLFQHIITAWPYGKVDFETYLDLPYSESALVDNSVRDAMTELSKKK